MDYIRRLKEKLTQNQNLGKLSHNPATTLPKSNLHDFKSSDDNDEDNDDT